MGSSKSDDARWRHRRRVASDDDEETRRSAKPSLSPYQSAINLVLSSAALDTPDHDGMLEEAQATATALLVSCPTPLWQHHSSLYGLAFSTQCARREWPANKRRMTAPTPAYVQPGHHSSSASACHRSHAAPFCTHPHASTQCSLASSRSTDANTSTTFPVDKNSTLLV